MSEISSEWVDLWEKRYDGKRYPEGDYAKFMMAIQQSTDDPSLSSALDKAFKWKDRFRSRWTNQISTVTLDSWRRLRKSTEIPEVFYAGIVYNVFLLHLASNGRRPMIDQHSWRAFCNKSGRGSNPVIVGINRETGSEFYLEYEGWFQSI